jgi:hypothetical protein
LNGFTESRRSKRKCRWRYADSKGASRLLLIFGDLRQKPLKPALQEKRQFSGPTSIATIMAGAPLPIRRAPPSAPPGAAPGRHEGQRGGPPRLSVHRTCRRHLAPCGPDRLQPAPERPGREGLRVRQMARTHPAASTAAAWRHRAGRAPTIDVTGPIQAGGTPHPDWCRPLEVHSCRFAGP